MIQFILFFLLPISSIFSYTAYVADIGSSAVFIIDTDTSAVIGTIDSGSFPPFIEPFVVLTSPDFNTTYIADGSTYYLYIIDSNANSPTFNSVLNAVAMPIPVGSFPYSMAITPNGNTIYIGISYSNGVIIFDTQSSTIIGSVSGIGDDPFIFNIAMYPDGTYAYANDINNGNLYIINTDASSGSYNTVTVTLTADYLSWVTVNPNGLYGYLSFVNGMETAVLVIDTDPTSMDWNQIIGEINTGDFTAFAEPNCMATSLDGNTLYILDGSNQCIYITDTNTNDVLAQTSVLLSTSPPFYELGVLPDNSQVYITPLGPLVEIIDAATYDLSYVANTIEPSFTATHGISFANSPVPAPSGLYDLNRLRPIYNGEVQAAQTLLQQAGLTN